MKKQNPVFTGSCCAMVTPMHADGSINYPLMGKVVDFLIEGHTDAICVCGTTGESATMNDADHIRCIAYVVEHVNGRVPVVAGVGSNDTAHGVNLSKEAAATGADALLHVTPYYNKASQKGLLKHFFACADATELPVILYNVPSRTSVKIQPKTYVELAKHPNIVATKEACGDISDIATSIAMAGETLDFYSGNDDQIVPILSLGGKGVISVLANIMPKETHEICQLFFDGRLEESRRLQLELLDLIHAIFIDVNPIPIKAAMPLIGFECGPCRLPMDDLSPEHMAVLRAAMARHGLCQA